MERAPEQAEGGPAAPGPAVLAAELRMALVRAVRRLRAEKSDADLTDGQYSVLAVLDRRGPRTPGELAAHERVQPPSMTRTLAALPSRAGRRAPSTPRTAARCSSPLTEAGAATRSRDPPPPRRLAGPAAGRPDRRRARRPRPRRRDPEEDRRLVSPTFRALHIHNYRLWATGAIVSNTGTWMQRVAQDWLVLTVLTDNSGTAVGITTGLQFLPMLLLAPVGRGARRPDDPAQAAHGDPDGAMGCWRSASACSSSPAWRSCGTSTCSPCCSASSAPSTPRPGRPSSPSSCRPHDLPNAVGLNSASFHAGPADRPRHRRAADPLVRHRPGLPHQRCELRRGRPVAAADADGRAAGCRRARPRGGHRCATAWPTCGGAATSS